MPYKVCIPCQYAEAHPLTYCPLCGRPYSILGNGEVCRKAYLRMREARRTIHPNVEELYWNGKGLISLWCTCDEFNIDIDATASEFSCPSCGKVWSLNIETMHAYAKE